MNVANIPAKARVHQASLFGDFVAGLQDNNRPEIVPTPPAKADVDTRQRPVGRFAGYDLAGYGRHLIPVAPPGVRVLRKNGVAVSGGKEPSQFDPQKVQWFGMPDWRNARVGSGEIAMWDSWGANVGLRTGEIVALDIDVKIDATDQSEAAARGRRLVDAIVNAAARASNVDPAMIPRRWRDGTTSCALFFRWRAAVRQKTRWTVCDRLTGRTFFVEIMAEGQQIVIAGAHVSGAAQHCTLAECPADALPMLGEAELARMAQMMADAAEAEGFEWRSSSVKTSAPAPGGDSSVLSPDEAIRREIWRRREEWIPRVLPLPASSAPNAELSISSDELGRDLQERLVIYADATGAHDFGTERSHTPISLICEFGAVLPDGDIEFGGCPSYGPSGRQDYAVVGELDPTVRRPTESEALTWLCRQFAGKEFEEFPTGATWASARARVAGALGVSWSALDEASVSQWFDAGNWPAALSDLSLSSADAGAFTSLYALTREQVVDKIAVLSALRLIAARDAERLETALEALDVLPRGYDAMIRSSRWEIAQASISPSFLPVAPMNAAEATGSASETEWPDPIDIFGDGDEQAFTDLPRRSMPDALERYSRDAAERMGVPAAFAAAGALAAASVAVGGRLSIQPKVHDTGWTERPFLWLVLVETPGGMKTPIIAEMTRPLTSLDNEWQREDAPKRNLWDLEARKARKGVQPTGPRPVVRRATVDSFTVEALRDVLAENARGVLVTSDELSGTLGSLDQYKSHGGSDRADLLKLMDGRERTIDRVGKTIHVKCWGASILGGVQPKKLRQMASTLDPDGLLQRFIPVIGDDVVRPTIDRRPDAAAARSYEDVLRGLANMPDIAAGEAVRLSDEAQQARLSFEARVLALRGLPNSSEAWQGHLGKWRGLFARILLVFHIVDQFDRYRMVDIAAPVSGEIASRAQRFASFLLTHSIRFYETILGADAAAKSTETAAGILLAKAADGAVTVSSRDIYQSHRAWRPNEPESRHLQNSMQALGQYGWCRPGEGNRGSEVWNINPKLIGKFRDRATAEKIRRATEHARAQAGAAERRALLQGGVEP